jgi:hypothetical protein
VTTSGTTARRALVCALAAVCVFAAGCRKFKSGTPPFEAFVTPEFHPPMGHAVFTPPDALKKPWRVMMLQNEPRPVKNPAWRSIPVEASGLIDMPDGSEFKCLYNPVEFRGAGDESFKGIERWSSRRQIRCTSDDWRTSVSTELLSNYAPDGKLEQRSSDQAELDLAEVIRGRPTQISILLRPD